jgi:hypothetical protein
MRCAFLLLLVQLTACVGEDRVERYASLDAARADGAIQRGWIPDFVPPSAANIVEKHNIDTNETWGRFEFAASDAESFASSLTEASVPVASCPRDAREEWWPHERISSGSEFRHYRAKPDGRVFFAIDWQRRVSYFWRCAA